MSEVGLSGFELLDGGEGFGDGNSCEEIIEEIVKDVMFDCALAGGGQSQCDLCVGSASA